MSWTRFSLVTACYNTGKYVRTSVESVLGQEYPRDCFELICIDDGSTDDSSAILRSFEGQQGFVLRRTANHGLESACNLGFSMAQHDRVVRVDADDLLEPGFLRTMDKAIQSYPGFDFYYCKDYIEYYSEEEQFKKTLPEFDVEEIFTRGDFFATGTVYRKDDLAASGFYETAEKNCGLENYNLTLRLLTRGKKGKAVPSALFKYRRHHENMSRLKLNAIISYGHELLRQYGREFKTNPFHPYGLVLPSSNDQSCPNGIL